MPSFAELVKRDREKQAARRRGLHPLELREAAAAFDANRSLGRNNLLRLLSGYNDNRHMVTKCGGAIHIAVCNYEVHQRTIVSAFQKIGDQVVRIPGGQPAESAVRCLQRLKSNLRSTPYIWAKAWVAMTPAALEAFSLGHPGTPIPIFARTPSPKEIEPLLAGAIEFAARPTAKTKAPRDNLLCTILVAYRLLTLKSPSFSRSPRKATLDFMRSIEGAYTAILPDGIDIPTTTHSTLDRLRQRSLLISDL